MPAPRSAHSPRRSTRRSPPGSPHGSPRHRRIGVNAFTILANHEFSRSAGAALENQLVLAGTGDAMVVVTTGDVFPSHLLVCVGQKVPGSPDPLERNGLSNGPLFNVVVPSDLDADGAVSGADLGILLSHW